jgi:5-formyltetrahydrofolate cyclo-ligase
MENPKSNSPRALKQEWRCRLKKRREALSVDRQQEAAQSACDKLVVLCESADFVLSFASFASEINLWSLNQVLAVQKRLVLPHLRGDGELDLFQVTDLNQLERHSLGMLEPIPARCLSVKSSQLTIALIPGLGFDIHTKYRLGYGLGCYDRLLASFTSTLTWGIGFQEQAVEGLPYAIHDVPLQEIYLF